MKKIKQKYIVILLIFSLLFTSFSALGLTINTKNTKNIKITNYSEPKIKVLE